MDSSKKIETIYKIYNELQELLNKESDLFKLATENRDEKIKFERDGKMVEATEGEMFEEVRITGINGTAGKLLGEKYKELFDVAGKREKKNEMLHEFILKELGFSFRQMSIVDYMKLTELLIDYKLKK